MAESVRQLNLLGDPLDLDGLEPLLERAHVEVVPPVAGSYVEAPVSETRLILDLMTQVELVNDLVMETSFKLERAHDSLLAMEQTAMDQEIRLERMKDLEAKVIELETWLEAAQAENTLLKRPWYKKLFNWRY
ncbi:hypothetical protein BH11CYA1_BH11CYA1_35310 [soil metagenome]